LCLNKIATLTTLFQSVALKKGVDHYFVFLFQDSNAYNAWAELKPSWVDFVTEFSSVRIPAGFYLTELPVLQPRYYSISNSPSMYPDQVHLTVGVLEYQVKSGIYIFQ